MRIRRVTAPLFLRYAAGLLLVFGVACDGASAPDASIDGGGPLDGGDRDGDSRPDADAAGLVRPEMVTLTDTTPCDTDPEAACPCGEYPGTQCLHLAVDCGGLVTRQVVLRQHAVSTRRGMVMLNTGGTGRRLYGDAHGPNGRRTIDRSVDSGIEVLEVRWLGADGIREGTLGSGFAAPACAYAALVRWVAANLDPPEGVLCAQGNSGGGSLIAYGLAVYELEDTLTTAIFSAGPGASRHDAVCFLSADPELAPLYQPADSTFRTAIDRVMGWGDSGHHCRDIVETPEAVQALQDTCLASPTQPRDYDFGTTALHFINSPGDPTGAQLQGAFFAARVTSGLMTYMIARATHAVDDDAEGAQFVQDILLAECRGD